MPVDDDIEEFPDTDLGIRRTQRRLDPTFHRREEHYEYKNLALLVPDTKVNVFAVVTSFSTPKKCMKGSLDYMVQLHVIDPSWDRSKPLTVLAFANSEARLPQVRQVGDIVRLHRVMCKPFDGRLQLVGESGAYSWLVMGSDGSVRTPEGTATVTVTDRDRQQFQALRIWFQSMPPPAVTLAGGFESRRCRLGNLDVHHPFVNTIVQVVALRMLDAARGELLVWDGSGQPPPPGSPLLPPVSPVIAFDRTRPVGSLVRLIVWSDSTFHGALLGGGMTPGDWLELRGVRVKPAVDDVLELKFDKATGVVKAAATSPAVKAILDEHETSLRRLYPPALVPAPASEPPPATKVDSPVTAVIGPGASLELTSIADVLAHDEPVGKFRTTARLVSFRPEIQDFARPYCSACSKGLKAPGPWPETCQLCGGVWRWQYGLELTLQDPRTNSQLSAGLLHPEAEKFFQGLPASNFRTNSESLAQLQLRVRRLRDAPAFEVGLLSWPVTSGRKYRSFDTVLLSS
eukprot:TRINITY_DN6665_c0_g1_i1.p1 TRINITY_DN6665_c0_g1~~TRINITY_DN6665_c0_g1_i1.p1  ORF type:complete len:515 (+),score=112.77 TRINITY_DN6665_c0_g1_i1:1501-3045(+)